MRHSAFVFLIFFITGCAKSELIIQSIPADAEVSVIDDDGKIKSIGKTPLKIPSDEVFRSSKGFSQIQLTKDNYEPQHLVMGKSSMPTNYEVSVNLKKSATDPKSLEMNSKNEKIAQQIALANSYIMSKKFFEAEQLIARFVQDYPHISVGYDYMGNIYYLKKDYKKALYYYEKGLTLNPENLETKDMVTKLKSIFN
ncbi:MAG: tetratricopeptide repeat protein [Bacteriovoracaceae bacterium]